MKRRIYKSYRRGKKRGGQRYHVGRKRRIKRKGLDPYYDLPPFPGEKREYTLKSPDGRVITTLSPITKIELQDRGWKLIKKK